MLTERIQSLVDRHVAGSPRARELLAALEGRTLSVKFRFTPWGGSARAVAGRLLVSKHADDAADVVLSGTPFSLLALSREIPADVIRRGDVRLDGDGEVAEKFQELLALLRPDLEAGLAHLIGDVPAHGAASLIRKVMGYGRGVARTQAQNAGEYLAHESRDLVPRAEASAYLAGVDALREQVDRVAARVALLEAEKRS
ncbi:MAG TPA: SCP2 sterol-binding domain-containing protein [Steroidobacteraceae bacterium]|nr:SCP2 sterol-binding domain-containing protein [Steroidobacteraceae bacterium]